MILALLLALQTPKTGDIGPWMGRKAYDDARHRLMVGDLKHPHVFALPSGPIVFDIYGRPLHPTGIVHGVPRPPMIQDFFGGGR